MIPDTCSCGKGRLKKGTTDFTVRVEGEIIVIRDVPAYVCDSCSEAYFAIETSRKIDDIMSEFRAGRLLTKPLLLEKRSKKGQKVPVFYWEGDLKDLGEQYSPVELQHEIGKM
jgi:YgiT-type zinc finger domain-containing protein